VVQALQVLAPSDEKCPPRQLPQLPDRANEYLPAGQALQLLAPSSENLPGSHSPLHWLVVEPLLPQMQMLLLLQAVPVAAAL
jgi:hypothetical protein